MTRRVRRYRVLTWACCAVALGWAILTAVGWHAGWTELLAVARIGVVLAILLTAVFTLLTRRGRQAADEIDFGVGIAGYPLDELDRYRHSA